MRQPDPIPREAVVDRRPRDADPTDALGRFEERREAGDWIMLSTHFGALEDALSLRHAATRRALIEGRRGEPAGAGRGNTRILEVSGLTVRLHLRRTLHGGALGPLWRGRLAGVGRVRRELMHTEALRLRGAPVPVPVLGLARRIGPLWEACVATVHEEGALDGAALAGVLEHDAVMRHLIAAATAIRRFHDCGGLHDDLHVGNLLFRPVGSELRTLVIDLDRGRATRPPSAARRRRELLRLLRSVRKRDERALIDSAGLAAFLDAYCQDDTYLRHSLAEI